MEFSLPVRVYYEDTDAGGVVYHSNYLKYFERGRTEVLRALGFEQDALLKHDDTIFAVRAIEMDYLKPARFNDALTVLTRIKSVGRASLAFEHSVSLENESTVLVTASARIACIKASTMKPRAIPEKIMQAMEASCAD